MSDERLRQLMVLQDGGLPGRPERSHPAGDEQGGSEGAVSGGGGPGLLPVTAAPVQHGCEWEPPLSPLVSLVSLVFTGLTGFYCAGCQLKDHQGPNH